MFRHTLPFLFAATLLCAQSKPLDIYWIDVEGGGATLIVTPNGQSFLADTGNPGDRDASRIFDVASKQAGLKTIDYVLITHFHDDHVGGAPALAKLIPVDHFLDHGESAEKNSPGGARLWQNWLATTGAKRQTLQAGDKVPLKGVDVEIVTAAGKVLPSPIQPGGPNSFCAGARNKDTDRGENGQSMGFVLAYNKFRFLDMGDLTWDREMELACPVNKIGTVALVQATHHGFYDDLSGAPALYRALKPEVVVVNNGATKGLRAPAFESIAGIPGLQAIWQVHFAVGTDDKHNTDDKRIANNDRTDTAARGAPADHAWWIKASVESNGKFTITNSRNHHSETYQAH
jgi:competence protein ComEC